MPQMEIEITALRVPVALGVHDFERKARQDVTVDLVMTLKSVPANDSIGETAHYDEVAAAVQQTADLKHYDLIETLALAIAERVKAFPDVARVTATVHKTPRTVPAERLSARVSL
ncbi:dihydroneopterin aldolase [Hyphobacterium indicum]|uniref:dihydroneopterin aldolase n=1 Tax=Hyphobacterium indicum TaxID=2162714 RepID=UPI001374BCBB|nr:dihydroneopterin aldolase [Hyphobacterium indicum]